MVTFSAKMLLAMLVAAATVTEAMNYLALPRMGRSSYLAFPRMGRRSGYLNFPRMGRAFPGPGSDTNQDGVDCCLTGLKTEWVPQEGGSTATLTVCEADSCCPGLRQLLAEKPNGEFYSMCVPAGCPAQDKAMEETSQRVLRKVGQLLQQN
ncbi:small cardioactive peptides-like [Babylonia areolata]|uniref:small cardioactive peptides-like n=1 Tax=Babylonia areolata TaxID=304850 RepID=UPI003FD39F45